MVDDDESVRVLLTRYLEMEGFTVEPAADGAVALEAIAANPPDLVLLDLMLPAHDGLDILTRLRRDSDVPVILLTARSSEADRILGLKLGADDYVVKPFSPGELSARISSVLRRTRGRRPQSALAFDGLMLDPRTREVTAGDVPVTPTAGSSTSWPSSPPRPARCSPASSSWPTCGTPPRSGRTPTQSPSTSAASAGGSSPTRTTPLDQDGAGRGVPLRPVTGSTG